MSLPVLKDVNNKDLFMVDGDTVSDTPFGEGKRYRIKGFDAHEKDHLYKKDGEWKWKDGSITGDIDTKVISEFLKRGNFKAVYENEDDYHGRGLISFVNHKGEDGVEELYKAGIARVDKWTDPINARLKDEAELANAVYGRTQTPYQKIGQAYQDTLSKMPLRPKTFALNEKEYNEALHSGVQWRDYDKTIDNKPLGLFDSMGDSWTTGWEGIKEGMYGYLDALGEVSNSEMIQSLGRDGMNNARLRMASENELLLDLEDVDGVLDGFTWVMNNAAMSAPVIK